MHFSVTDLPVPEPPMITSALAGHRRRARRPASTWLSPNALRTSMSSIRGVAAEGSRHQKKASVSR